MSRQLENYGINILKLHAEWLVANGYKQQATSCKRQIRMILINKKKKELQATSDKLLTKQDSGTIKDVERNKNYGLNN